MKTVFGRIVAALGALGVIIGLIALYSGNIEKITGVKPVVYILEAFGKVTDEKRSNELSQEADRLYFETSQGQQSVAIYQEAAELGNPYAKAVLAKIYHHGLFEVGENQEYAAALALEAFPELESTATSDPTSAYALGYLFEHGIGVNPAPKTAVMHYAYGAKSGHAPSQNLLSAALGDGKIVAEDKKAALSWGLAAAKQGHKGAMRSTGIAYRFGWGASPNVETAVFWLTKAAQLNEEHAQAHLAEIYEFGELGQPDLTQAEHWYSQAAAQGEPYSLMKTGSFRWNRGGDKLLAYNELKEAAELGSSLAQLNMARFVARPENFDPDGKIGIKKNYDLSVEYYRKAAASGLVEALDELSAVQIGAYGPEFVDFTSAFENATKCANEISNLMAICKFRLAYLNENGFGTEKNLGEAELLYDLAYNEGIALAGLELSDLLEEKYGVNDVSINLRRLDLLLGAIELEPKNSSLHAALGHLYRANLKGVDGGMTKAADAFEIAAQLGSLNGACNLGFCYLHGNGRPQNFEEAIKWMTIAAETGLLPPLKNLYALAESDIDVKITVDQVNRIRNKGLQTYISRAKTEDCIANSLAQRYERGDVIDRNLNAAVVWYLKAAELGSSSGAYNYARMTLFDNALETVNPLESRKWLEMAARNGSGPANLLLAIAHYKGKFGEPDTSRSEHYFRLAKDMGVPLLQDAREALPAEWVSYYTGRVMSCEGDLQAPVILP